MDGFWKLLGVILTGCVAVSFSRDSGFRWLIAAACCCLCASLVAELVQPVFGIAEKLAALSGVSETLLAPVCKATVIGVVSQIGTAYCQDHAERTLAELLELGAVCAVFYVTLPVLQTALDMLQRLSEA